MGGIGAIYMTNERWGKMFFIHCSSRISGMPGHQTGQQKGLIMIGPQTQQGISFTSRGQVIEEK
jgi:hypothetical protein